jgi:hypothetical protein
MSAGTIKGTEMIAEMIVVEVVDVGKIERRIGETTTEAEAREGTLIGTAAMNEAGMREIATREDLTQWLSRKRRKSRSQRSAARILPSLERDRSRRSSRLTAACS